MLLGQSEVIASGSDFQFLPSSLDYDTGTDSMSNPSLHVIWSPFINSHILPWYIVSFTSEEFECSSLGPVRKTRQATSEWNEHFILFQYHVTFCFPGGLAS